MVEMAIDFVQTGKEIEEERASDEDAKRSYQDLRNIEQQLKSTLDEIRVKVEEK